MRLESQALARIQDRFAAALDDPAACRALLPALRGDPATAQGRLALYERDVAARWERALAAGYPVLRSRLGEQVFSMLSGAYARRFPSRSGDLNRFGASLEDFLAELCRAPPESRDVLPELHPACACPWLPDLARLEWAVHCAHYAADTPALSAAAVAALNADELDQLAVGFHPACAVHVSPWNVTALWHSHQQEPERSGWRADSARAVIALIWRQAWRVAVRELEHGEAAALATLRRGACLGDALEAACDADRTIDIAALVERWLRDGLLVL